MRIAMHCYDISDGKLAAVTNDKRRESRAFTSLSLTFLRLARRDHLSSTTLFSN